METALERRMCSFCGAPGSRRRRLAGGLGAMICRSCVNDIKAAFDDREVMRSRTGPVWEDMSDAELLAQLPLILASASQSEQFASEWVTLLRDRGVSWAHVGQVLGISRQAAWQRFSPNSDRAPARRAQEGSQS